MSATGRRTGWNGAGFFLPYSWLLYRKNMAAGATALLFFISEKIATALLMARCFAGSERFSSYAELYQALRQALAGPQAVYLYLIAAFALCNLGIRVLCGLFGNRIYIELEISVDGSMPLQQAHEIAETVHNDIEQAFPAVKHIMIHVNPTGEHT